MQMVIFFFRSFFINSMSGVFYNRCQGFWAGCKMWQKYSLMTLQCGKVLWYKLVMALRGEENEEGKR